MDLFRYVDILVPVVSALIGAFAGYLIARFKYRSERERGADKVALGLVEKEWERLASQDDKSEFSAIAHWAVLRKLLDEFQSKGYQLSDLKEIRDNLDSKCQSVCTTFRTTMLLRLYTELQEINLNEADRKKVEEIFKSRARFTSIKELADSSLKIKQHREKEPAGFSLKIKQQKKNYQRQKR
jgi:hypothetical protein